MPARAQPRFGPRGTPRRGGLHPPLRLDAQPNPHFHCVVVEGVFDAATTGGIIFTAATELDANAIAQVQAQVRRRRRYCARPRFALDRVRELDRERLIYDPPKPGPGARGPQFLTPLELLDRLAALVLPPRLHNLGSTRFNARSRPDRTFDLVGTGRSGRATRASSRAGLA